MRRDSDPLLEAAARALAAGDPLGALKRVALREDAPALALRGTAMAQLGELGRARELLHRAAREFDSGSLARARCIVARAEVALASRDLEEPSRELAAALRTLEAHGDRTNALYARLLSIRHALLIGRIDHAEGALEAIDLEQAPPMLAAIGWLLTTDIALRRVRTRPARIALTRARKEAQRAAIPALVAEVQETGRALEMPAARLVAEGRERTLLLAEVEDVLSSNALVIDACRRVVRHAEVVVSLARRPILFALLRALGEAWPHEVAREELVRRAFGVTRPNESHRARLRVEIGRMRRTLRTLGDVIATKRGFVLGASSVAVLLPPIDGNDGALLALLADGEAWSTSALALALGSSQRTVQRALSSLEAAGKVRSRGRARARRWLAQPVTEFTTTLLLPAAAPVG